MPHRVDDQWILNKLIPYLVVKALLIWSNSSLPSFWIIALPLFCSPEVHSPLHHQWVLSKTENLALFFCLKTLQSLPRYTSWSLSVAAWTWGSLWSGSHPPYSCQSSPVKFQQHETCTVPQMHNTVHASLPLPRLLQIPETHSSLSIHSLDVVSLTQPSSVPQSPLCSIFVSYLYFLYHISHYS